MVFMLLQIPEGVARRETAIWHETTDGKVELPFEVDIIKEAVEKFFHNEFKSINIKDKSDSPKQVSYLILYYNKL